jgi:hypothetical protein
VRNAVRSPLALVVFAGLALVPSPAFASTRCGRIAVHGYRGTAKVRIVSGPASCSGARGLIGDAFGAFLTRPYQGVDNTYGDYWYVRGYWRCSHGLGGSQAFCFSGRRRIDGSFRSDDGWSF